MAMRLTSWIDQRINDGVAASVLGFIKIARMGKTFDA
jgi:hypothetical protein